MNNREIALEYIRCFCNGDIDDLLPLLADSLRFSGTLHDYYSAAEYIESLRNDPPEIAKYSVLSITEGDDTVAVFYEYQKPESMLQIAQLFKISESKINEILLIFDGRNFD